VSFVSFGIYLKEIEEKEVVDVFGRKFKFISELLLLYM
jgi:hypothetical protein